MGVHTVAHFLGGTIPVEADFIVGRNGDLELSDTRVGSETIDDPDHVGEFVDGKWKKLTDLLADRARDEVEDWLAEDRARDRELMQG
jgi:hypothetical protein